MFLCTFATVAQAHCSQTRVYLILTIVTIFLGIRGHVEEQCHDFYREKLIHAGHSMDDVTFFGALSALIGLAIVCEVARDIYRASRKVEMLVRMPGTGQQQEEYGDRFMRRYCPVCGTWTVTMRLRCDVDQCYYTATQEDVQAIETAVYERLFVHEWRALEKELSLALTREEVAKAIELREDIDMPLSTRDLWHWITLRRQYADYRAADCLDSEQNRLNFARWLFIHGKISEFPTRQRRHRIAH